MAKAKNKLNNSSEDFLLDSSSPFTVREAYKALRTNVTFSLPGEGCKVIAVTSDNRGEGKSTSASNTAVAFAEIGKRVVLVDCDLRLPTIATRFDIPQKPGLSDLLIGEVSSAEAMHKVRENLNVIPAGHIPKDPTKLFESEVMARFFEKLREIADIVIVDLPPVNTVIDAAILAPHIDGYLLVARHNFSNYRDINEELRLLKLAGANIIGFLYNDAPVESKKYYSKHYYG